MKNSLLGVALLVLLGLVDTVAAPARVLLWPTSEDVFFRGGRVEDFVQPTATQELTSGLFGSTRNGGRRFHEGIDIKSFHKDLRGEAADRIVAAMDGRVAYAQPDPSKSSYGRYVILVHEHADVPVHTLYAHLRSIDPAVHRGEWIRAGQVLGVMGRSAAGYSIPRERAHLHFEIGVRLSDDFPRWYATQGFGSPNHHGLWNGMNLVGIDPLPVFESVRQGSFTGFREHIFSLPTAFTVRLATQRIPSFVRRYPGLVDGVIPPQGVRGWIVEFTWYGFPKRWMPLQEVRMSGRSALDLVYFDPASTAGQSGRKTVMQTPSGPVIGEDLKRFLELLLLE